MNIALPNGMVAIIDDQDAELASGFKWRSIRSNRGRTKYYVRAGSGHTGAHIYLHRLILAAPRHMLVDHVNGDGLDNRRENLRLCTPSQNGANRPFINKHGFRGVCKQHGCIKNPYFAYVSVNRKRYKTGYFATAFEAAHAYDALASEHYGEFAILNFPTGGTR